MNQMNEMKDTFVSTSNKIGQNLNKKLENQEIKTFSSQTAQDFQRFPKETDRLKRI